MTPENIKTLLYQTQGLMYGFNYEVTLGIEIFRNCFSLSDVNRSIRNMFPKSKPEDVSPVLVSVEEFWQEVTEAFDYRGDNNGVSLKLDERQERELKSRQSLIKEFIAHFIRAETQIYGYPFLEGVPGYPVFWEYMFVLLNTDGDCVLFYGSSSD